MAENSLLKFLIDEIDLSLSSQFYAKIKAWGFAELVNKNSRVKFGNRTIANNSGNIPARYIGNGDYEPVGFNDNFPLNTYHRLLSASEDEDLNGGYGKNTLVIQRYSLRLVAFGGSQRSIKDVTEDINYQVGNDFSSLIRIRLTKPKLRAIKAYSVNVSITNKNYDKSSVFGAELSEEVIKYKPENILFAIDYSIEIRAIKSCEPTLCETIIVEPTICPEGKTASEMTCEELTNDSTGLQPEQIEECFDAITTNATFIF